MQYHARLGGCCSGVRILRPVAPHSRLSNILRSQSHRIPPPKQPTPFDQPSYRRIGQFFPIRNSTAVGYWAKSMKRTFALILATLAAVTLFAGLVHAVLVAAHVSEPAATTVYGLTPRRLWATAVALLALVGVVIGGLALRRSASRIGTGNGRMRAIVALLAGLIAA